MASPLESVLKRIDSQEAAAVARLCDLLRIPSVSTDPAHAHDVARCADALVHDLRTMGFNAESVRTAGHPMVLAHHPGTGGSGAPRVLYYGHYDVQPADPVELWESPPFEPRVVDGPHGKRVVARGAVDDKGQVMMFVEAFRAWHEAAGGPPCPVTVMLEGEEESGSASLEPFMRSHAKQLACDVAVVSDTGMWDIDTPAITTSLRGLCYLEATLTGPSHDLHSGMYGGSLRNPINALASMIASLHDPTGRVAVAGFYDGVLEPSPEVLESWGKLGFGEGSASSRASVEMYKEMAGIDFLRVPYKSNPQAVTDLVSGQVVLMIADMVTLLPQVKAGKLRALAVSTPKRLAILPDLPTMSEAGVKGYELTVWFAGFMPSGSPADAIKRMAELFGGATKTAKMQEFFVNFGGATQSSTPDELGRFVASETAKWARIVKSAGIVPE